MKKWGQIYTMLLVLSVMSSPITAATGNLNVSQIVSTQYTENSKVTTIDHPKVIDGRAYVTKEQLESALDLQLTEIGTDFINTGYYYELKRKDLLLSYSEYGSVESGVAYKINGSCNPRTIYDGEPLIIENDKAYFPIGFIAKYANAKVAYNVSKDKLTITYNGISKPCEMYDESVNYLDIKGKVTYSNGTPAANVTVYLDQRESPIEVNEAMSLTTNPGIRTLTVKTDENGNYVFKNINTQDIKWFTLKVWEKVDRSLYYGYPMHYLTPDGRTPQNIIENIFCFSPLDKTTHDIQLTVTVRHDYS